MAKRKGVHLIEKLTHELDFSPDLLLGGMSIELFGGRQAIVEGMKNIVEYDENVLRVDNGKNEVRILGTELTLRCMTQDSVIVEGNISSAEYSGKVNQK